MAPGDPVRLVTTKWVDNPHWEYDCYLLGSDEYGDWVGAPAGTHMSRPGMEVTTSLPFVCLVPRPGAGGGAGWIATFNAPGHRITTYVDMTTVPQWTVDGSRVSAVDLDLDVVERADGTTYVDDEDEFAEHQVKYGYPPDVIATARQTCDWLVQAVATEEPFLTVYKTHLDKIR